jgi:hypothetical protein
MVMASKTGKKAANAAEKARRTQTLNAAQRKHAACRRKLLAKNERKAKNRAARQAQGAAATN